jgi:hypothetical protein
MKESPWSSVHHVHKSKQKYYMKHENHFCLLPDGKTIIGSGGGSSFLVIAEDITRNDDNYYSQIGKHTNNICSIFYNAIQKSLFVGDENSHVIEYKQKGSYLFWGKKKDYGKLGIGRIHSSEQIRDVLIFGGSSFSIRAIDCAKNTLLPGKVQTAISNILSLQACELPGKKIFLAVSGSGQYYTEEETDIYEVFDFDKARNYYFLNQPQIHHGKEKDKIKKEKAFENNTRIKKSKQFLKRITKR